MCLMCDTVLQTQLPIAQYTREWTLQRSTTHYVWCVVMCDTVLQNELSMKHYAVGRTLQHAITHYTRGNIVQSDIKS